jgi:hypothetical protein
MIEYLPQALSCLDTALTIGRSLIGIRDTVKRQDELVKFNNAIVEVQTKIISAQRNESALLTEVDELKKEIMRLKDWSASKAHYSCKQVGEGVSAYVQNEAVQSFETARKLCCNCFDNKQLMSTLQQSREPGRMKGLACPNGCPKIVFTHYFDPM